MPCGTIGQRTAIFSCRPAKPSGPRFESIGTRDIDSTPAATTTSRYPAWIAAAPLNAACIDDPHCLSTVVAATVSGHPATSAAMRPMLSACSPICVTQPICTSSTSVGSRPILSTSPFRASAARSSARTVASVPFRRPIGERTASMMRASATTTAYWFTSERNRDCICSGAVLRSSSLSLTASRQGDE